MSSIQERLQLKRVPLDTWSIREKLCLASAVVRSGDQNWMSVSRALKTIGDANRPSDWYSQKSCAAQYGALLEHVETPKRKKRSSEGAAETPQESILKQLTQERIAEIQESVNEINRQYEQLKNEITEARNPTTSEDRLREMWNEIEAAKRAREREHARRAACLKEREERRARAERTWRPPAQPPTPGGAAPSSPLLTSLLKSSPVVTTPQNIIHPANVIETVSPSAGAPTLSMLLESREKAGAPPRPTTPENKHAAIEHIKSQLVQIERQLKEKSAPPTPVAVPAPAPPAVDIDDIEIKAEDVYAFRDIDLHIPPVATMHKPSRPPEKPLVKKDDTEEIIGVTVTEDKAEQMIVEEVKEEQPQQHVEPIPQTTEQPEQLPPPQPQEPEPVSAPEPVEPDAEELGIGFPTAEIKVIASADQGEETEDVNVVDDVVEEAACVQEPTTQLEQPEQVELPEKPAPVVPEPEEAAAEIQESQPSETVQGAEEIQRTEDIPLPAGPGDQVVEAEPPAPEIEPEPEVAQEEKVEQEMVEEREETTEETVVTPTEDTANPEPEILEEKIEDPTPEKEVIQEAPPAMPEPEVPIPRVEPPVAAAAPETHAETDDDTPMELSREEEKDGKKKRDYSRKKKADSRTCSGSESAEASAPESPGIGSDAERQHRLWKKSVMLVYSRLCAHKYASLFLRPITDEEAPGYSLVVRRPMDLTTIRKNIDAGHVRTTAEFQRDVLLMLSNALMYNSSEHSVYTMAKQMLEEAQNQLSMLVAAQAHAGLAPAPPARRKRRRPVSPQGTPKRLS